MAAQEAPFVQAQPPETAAVAMVTAIYMYFHKLRDAYSDVAASRHLAGLKPASGGACKTLAQQAASYDVELAMYNNKHCENLSHHILVIATPAPPPPPPPHGPSNPCTQANLLCCAQSMCVCLPCLRRGCSPLAGLTWPVMPALYSRLLPLHSWIMLQSVLSSAFRQTFAKI